MPRCPKSYLKIQQIPLSHNPTPNLPPYQHSYKMLFLEIITNFAFAVRPYQICQNHNKKKYFDDYIIYQDKKYVSLQWYLD